MRDEDAGPAKDGGAAVGRFSSARRWLLARVRRLKGDIPALFLALSCARTPWYAKVLAALTVAYALSPIDLIPDFVPVLGFLDDVLLLPALVALVVRCVPAEVFADCRARAEGLWAAGKPKKWYYALPIVLVWALLIFLLGRKIFAW